MSADLILIATLTVDEGNRIAHSMAQLGSYSFVLAQTVDDAVQAATSLQPDLVIAALADESGIALCGRLRALPETRTGRVLLLIDRQRLNEARTAGANAVLPRPASALLAGHEAKATLERIERRALWVPDRRTAFRGGRRLTDIGVG